MILFSISDGNSSGLGRFISRWTHRGSFSRDCVLGKAQIPFLELHLPTWISPLPMPQVIKKGQPQAVERIFVVKQTKRGKKVLGKDKPVPQGPRESQSPEKKRGRMLDLPHASPKPIGGILRSPSPKRRRTGKVRDLPLN